MPMELIIHPIYFYKLKVILKKNEANFFEFNLDY